MIDLEKQHLKIIQDILKKYPYQFYAFGSRVRGYAHTLSDLDLCIMDDVSMPVLAKIQADFEESDLPFKVDVVVWNHCSSDFQHQIKHDMADVQEISKINQSL